MVSIEKGEQLHGEVRPPNPQRRDVFLGGGVSTPESAVRVGEEWFAPGAPVAELEYLGHGRHAAVSTTVERLTPSQIITATGRRFWRNRAGRSIVGQTSRQHARPNPIRIAPVDSPAAIEALAATRSPASGGAAPGPRGAS